MYDIDLLSGHFDKFCFKRLQSVLLYFIGKINQNIYRDFFTPFQKQHSSLLFAGLFPFTKTFH